jgi:hypothetical protein
MKGVLRMAKAILVMDMPKYCIECPFCTEEEECIAFDVNTIEVDILAYKPKWCPLREVPQKKELWSKFELGYNACIDEILGGGE